MFYNLDNFLVREETAGHGFSGEELMLLNRYGHWMQALATSVIQPVTEAQKRFVDVANGRAMASALQEHAWMKLMAARQDRDSRCDEPPPQHFDPAERWFPRSQCWVNNRGRYP